MALFGPASWTARTGLPGMVDVPTGGGYRAPGSDFLFIASNSIFGLGSGVNERIQVNEVAVSFDRASSWFVTGSPGKTVVSHWSIEQSDGTLFYFRAVKRFGRNFFAGNSEIFPGFLNIEWSDDGVFFSPLQDLYTWGHFHDNGAVQAQNTIDVKHLFIPGSGPGGADADWLFVRCHVFSDVDVPVDAYDRWRSDDFGATWAKVGAITGLSALSSFLVRGPSGRIIAENGAMFKSDDNGATFTGAGGVLPAQNKADVMPQAGGTFVILLAGGLASQASAGVSCDDGGTWGGSANFNAQNSNPRGLRLGPSETLVFCRDSDLTPTGVNIWYSTDGGETYTLQGKDTRWPALQTSLVFATIMGDGAPLGIGLNNVVLASTDRPTGNFTQRTICPLAFAGLRKAGIPNLCGHSILQNRC